MCISLLQVNQDNIHSLSPASPAQISIRGSVFKAGGWKYIIRVAR